METNKIVFLELSSAELEILKFEESLTNKINNIN